ncbi:AEC family transporter [Elioraea tepidiphila]|uniref:AEC family transporter n=1 Tax=Elioraea tepidiphila TaxID=457934 RepID=UPI00037D4CEC|nr:AEC family transporter [Elioraea tepidiphila]
MLPPPILLPFFALIALGYALGRGPLALPAAQNGLRIFVLYAALPAFIFRFVVEAAAPPAAALLAPAAFALAMLATAAAAAALTPHRARALAAMGSISANVGYMGLPAIAVSPLGADPAATGAAIAILVIDVLGTMNANMLLLTRGGLRAGAAAMLRAPLVWAMLAGLSVRLSGIALPAPVMSLAAMLAGGAVPGALISLGAALAVGGGALALAPLRPVRAALPGKLILHPALAWIAAAALGLPGGATAATVLMAATPTSLGYFLIAGAGGQDIRAAAALCLWTTVLSLPTLALWSAALTYA